MTPLRLELAGFSCFRQAVSIDFSELELFAIYGPTGSGKSMLLDALTYALYGQTPRLGSKGLDALISPGLTQMYVVLEFQSHRGTFKVTRTADKKASGTVTRNTRIEALQADASYKQLAESEKLKEADAKLEDLVGLDYDGFSRSVLLPQGAFDEFLRGDMVKRRKLLVKLLALDKVELMQKEAGRIAREADAEVKNLKERLEQDYAGASLERRADLELQIKETQATLTSVTQQQQDVTERLKALEDLKTITDEQQKLERSLNALQERAGEMAAKRSTLDIARKAQLIAPQLLQHKRIQEKYHDIQKDLSQLVSDLELQQQAYRAAEQSLLHYQKRLAERLPELGEKLTRLAALKPLMSQLKARGGSLELAQQTSTVNYSDDLWESFQARQAQLPMLRQAALTARQSQQDLAATRQALNDAKSQLSELEKQLQQLIEQGKDARLAQTMAKEAYESALIANQALALREHLHMGDLCPVCEQHIKVLPERKDPGLAAVKQALEQAEQQLEEITSHYQTSKTNLLTCKERYEDKLSLNQRLEAQVSEQESQLSNLLNVLEVTTPEEAERVFAKQRQDLLAALAQSIYLQSEGLDPESAVQALEQERQNLEKEHKTAEARFQALKTQLAGLQSRKELVEKQVNDLQLELNTASENLETSLRTADFASAEALHQALIPEDEQKRLEAELLAFGSQKEAAEKRALELHAKRAGRIFDEHAYQALKTEQDQLMQSLASAQRSLGSLEQELASVEIQLKKAKALQKERVRQEHIYDTYRALSQDLQGNRFQEFLLSQVQAKLAQRASQILRNVTDGRYDLYLIDGDYQVRDAWNSGELRHARTLSGGETFIASLALALALSDTIAGSQTLGALFLDEGFGTLDSLSLDAVATVLENLSKEGRMVGVISHVAALTERLPARLSVIKGKDGSSLSWDLA